MNKRSSWFMGVFCSVVLAFGLSLSGYAVSADQALSSSIEQKILAVKSKADHEALAAYYENEAKDIQATAQMHRSMSDAYEKVGFAEKNVLRRHCISLAQEYEAAANENLEMAKIHRGLAEKMN